MAAEGVLGVKATIVLALIQSTIVAVAVALVLSGAI
jgi:hypothetical protein